MSEYYPKLIDSVSGEIEHDLIPLVEILRSPNHLVCGKEFEVDTLRRLGDYNTRTLSGARDVS